MAEHARGAQQDRTAGGLDRRQMLRRTAVVGGAMWAAPALLTVSRASAAELHSAPPSGGKPDEVGGSVTERPGPVAQPTPVGGADQVALPTARQPQPVAARGTLPRTGADVDRLVGTGVAAVATGTLLRWWSADRVADGAPNGSEPTAPPA